MPGGGLHYSVFDNLLLVHIGHSGRAQIIDVAGGGSAAVSAAQPFAMAQLGVGHGSPQHRQEQPLKLVIILFRNGVMKFVFCVL